VWHELFVCVSTRRGDRKYGKGWKKIKKFLQQKERQKFLFDFEIKNSSVNKKNIWEKVVGKGRRMLKS
jgi:hypothetical protein